MKINNLMVEMLLDRFVTKPELQDLFNLSERQVRLEIQKIKLFYPVICSCNRKGWKIATTEDDIPLVEESIRENRQKAISIFEGQKKLREFLKGYDREGDPQMSFDF
jgi:hypothetical protein